MKKEVFEMKKTLTAATLTLATLCSASPLSHGSKIIQAAHSAPIHTKQYDTIIFDFGGVILDEHSAPAAIAKGWPGSKEHLKCFGALYSSGLWLDLMRDSLSDKEVATHLEAQHGFQPATTHELLRNLPLHMTLLKSGVEMLHTAKAQGYKILMLSNIYKSCIEPFMQQHPSLKLFDGFVFSCDERRNKPEPEIYQILLQRFNVDPAKALFIDDREENVVAGAALGIDGIVCKNATETLQLLRENGVLKTAPTSYPMGTKLITTKNLSTKANKYTSIIFDLGGVLFDNTQALSLAGNLWPNTQAVPMLLSLFGDPILKELYHGTATAQQAADYMQERYGYDAALTTDVLNNLSKCLPLLPRGVEMLHIAKAQGYKIYLFTDIYKECLTQLQSEYSFFNLFDGIVASCDVGSDKSTTTPFQTLLNRYAIKPEEALLIDDTEGFVQTAATLGIDGVVCANTGETLHLLREHSILKKKSATHHSQGTRLIQANPTQQKKYTTLVFDLGQVLINWQPERTAEELFPGTAASSIMGALFHDPHWLNFDRNTVDIPGLAKLAREKYHFDENLALQTLTAMPKKLPIISQLVDVLYAAKAQGYKLYVLSNMPKPYLEAFIQHHDFFSLFDGMMASYETGNLKPEISLYNDLFNKFSLNPAECLFIDDVDANILAGASLGMDGIVCQNHDEVVKVLVENKILSHVPQREVEQSISMN
jgi:putative hydrolase of the HAD superfamily